LSQSISEIATVHARCAERFPDVALDLAAFRRHCERLGLPDQQLAARGDDLFLVAAVLENVPGALLRFDACLTAAARVIARIDATPSFIDDLAQELRVKLLTGEAPKLWTYAGAGPLVDWLRVIATRAALNAKRGDRLHPVENLPEAVLEGGEALHLARRYLGDLQEALREAMERLTARERTLLRLHFIDGLSIDRIGALYQVNRTTVARWLVAIRRRLFEEVRATLGARHGLDTAEVRSLYRKIGDDVHVTMSRVLVR